MNDGDNCLSRNLSREDARPEPCDCELPQYRGDSCEKAPSPMAAPSGNVRDINITKLNYGYIVTVGCHKFAIEKPETVTEKLGEYLKDPLATEKKWFDNKLF
jgi:hypothetical protein